VTAFLERALHFTPVVYTCGRLRPLSKRLSNWLVNFRIAIIR
jgi:hypothetical protein